MADSFDRLKTALSDRYAIDEEIGAGGKNVDYGHHLRERPRWALDYSSESASL